MTFQQYLEKLSELTKEYEDANDCIMEIVMKEHKFPYDKKPIQYYWTGGFFQESD